MVLPLVDEDKPKCYFCHKGFDDIDALRVHQKAEHADSENGSKLKKEPAAGDVTIF